LVHLKGHGPLARWRQVATVKYGAAALAAFILLLVTGSLLATSVEHYALQASHCAVQAWHYVWAHLPPMLTCGQGRKCAPSPG
jgi:hypothetical protein